MGYPGGIFDPLGFSKGNLKELQTKEIKNGRIAMVAFMSFVVQVRARVRPACVRGPSGACRRGSHACLCTRAAVHALARVLPKI
jgi:hypothetical protein